MAKIISSVRGEKWERRRRRQFRREGGKRRERL
jgi:hypothetical protein